jgi:hypothetical protein
LIRLPMSSILFKSNRGFVFVVVVANVGWLWWSWHCQRRTVIALEPAQSGYAKRLNPNSAPSLSPFERKPEEGRDRVHARRAIFKAKETAPAIQN